VFVLPTGSDSASSAEQVCNHEMLLIWNTGYYSTQLISQVSDFAEFERLCFSRQRLETILHFDLGPYTHLSDGPGTLWSASRALDFAALSQLCLTTSCR